jgi:hypothetical protein
MSLVFHLQVNVVDFLLWPERQKNGIDEMTLPALGWPNDRNMITHCWGVIPWFHGRVSLKKREKENVIRKWKTFYVFYYNTVSLRPANSTPSPW